MKLYRIADARFPLWSGQGASLYGGRWNSPGRPVIYCALSRSCAMLEVLVHANIGRVPRHHACIEAVLTEAVSVERLQPENLPQDWGAPESEGSRSLGDEWLTQMRCAVLLVPSVLVPQEYNALVNPAHPDFERIQVGRVEPVVWDERLFKAR